MFAYKGSQPPQWSGSSHAAPTSVAYKVMPIGGQIPINDEPQKQPEEMLAEVMATLRLSALAATTAPSFIHAHAVRLCQGAYPSQLLCAWDSWKDDNSDKCENERPVGWEWEGGGVYG